MRLPGRMWKLAGVVALVVALGTGVRAADKESTAAPEKAGKAEQSNFFRDEVRPIFENHCVHCCDAGFTTLLAGGGVKAGFTFGATDDFGIEAIESRVSVAYWHTKILRLLGLDYEKTFFERSGFKEKLTGVEKCRVVEELFA